jgi:hypothetical protein
VPKLHSCGQCVVPLLLLITGVAGGGCSSGNPLGAVPVTGKVTYKGQPVAGATVSFLGEGDTRPATAVTASDGSYALMTLDYRGAVPGTYAVVVRKTELPIESLQPVSMEDAVKLNTRPPPRPKELLPAKYGDASKTPLKFEVKKGQPNRFDLELAD